MAEDRDTDEELLSELGAAMHRAAVVPAWFLDTASTAFEWHQLNIDLAVVTQDSATEPELAGARADPLSVRSMTFTGRAVTIGLEIDRDAVHGQVAPPQAGTIEIRARDGVSTTVAVDEDGWFAVRPKPAGAFRLLFRSDGGHSVLTDWAIV